MSLHRRAVRVRLRGGRSLHGRIHVAEGQSLVGFLGARKFFLNLTDVRWEDEQETDLLSHLSVRMRQIIWVEPLDAVLHLSSAEFPTDEKRRIELHLEGGDLLHVQLNLASETRMSDYLDANPLFISLFDVHALREGRTIERVALNHGAILAIRELDEPGS